PAFYLPVAQHSPTVISVVAGTQLNLRSFAVSARKAIRDLNIDQPIERFVAVDDLVSAATAQNRFASAMMLGLAMVALVVSGIGIFAAVEATISERTRELALRIALGADRASIRWFAI